MMSVIVFQPPELCYPFVRSKLKKWQVKEWHLHICEWGLKFMSMVIAFASELLSGGWVS